MDAEAVAHERAGVRDELLGGRGGDDEEVDGVGSEAGVLDRGGARLDGEARGRLAARGDATFADAGALDDPLVAGVDALLELGVGEPLLGEGGAPTRDAGAHAQATRSQATGWPSRRRSPGWTSMPTSLPRNGLHTGVEVPGPSRRPTVWPTSTRSPSSRPSSGAEHADRRGDDHALGNEEPLAVGQKSLHGLTQPPDFVGMSSGLATLRTATSGAPRLASAASIEPWPTSRNVSAPAATSVSMVERQRTGTETCVGEPLAPAVGVGVGDRVVVRHHRRRGGREGHRRQLRDEPGAGVGHQRRVERAADVERRDPLHAELLGPDRRAARAPRACRRSRPGRGRCRWRPSSRRGPPSHAPSACSAVAPSSAAMRPGCASAAAWVSSARRAAKRTPSSKGRLPAAISAVTWPSEWPANATGGSASGCIASHATSELSSTASCAFACAREDVGGSVGDEVGERLTERGFGALDDRPAGWSRQTKPMPGSWVPCPGKTTATPTVLISAAVVEVSPTLDVRRRVTSTRRVGCMRVSNDYRG